MKSTLKRIIYASVPSLWALTFPAAIVLLLWRYTVAILIGLALVGAAFVLFVIGVILRDKVRRRWFDYPCRKREVR